MCDKKLLSVGMKNIPADRSFNLCQSYIKVHRHCVTNETLERAVRRTKAKSITSCDNAFVTYIVSAEAAHWTPPRSFALRESEASATNVLSVRKRSGSGKCFICAKAKRQQQMFYLCESEASATNVLSARKRSVSNKCFICAKAKRQRQMFYLCESEASATNVLSVRKRSVSNKCFICAKAKRQRQMFYLRESEAAAAKRPVGTEINHTLW